MYATALQEPKEREDPTYLVDEEAGFFADGTLFPRGEHIYWVGEPNPKLIPTNNAAKERMIAYLQKLDEFGREAAKRVNRGYQSLEDAFKNARALQENTARQVGFVDALPQTEIFGDKYRFRNSRAAKVPKEETVRKPRRTKAEMAAAAKAE